MNEGEITDPRVARILKNYALAKEGINPKEHSARDIQGFLSVMRALNRKYKMKELEYMNRMGTRW